MKLSKFLLPILKEDPREAQIVSHKLMLRAGMIRQLSAGIYNWLPLGWKVLRNIEKIVQEEMDKAGAQEILMPTMQPVELWEESGRGGYGKETLIATDRNDRKLIYGPTNEEVVTDIFRNNVRSYKNLPINLYHIQWKFRDEIRPRFGVMRGREFLMKDAYSFDIDEQSAQISYDNMLKTYFRIFKRMGLKAIPFKADTGAIGGDLSHEFQVIAETGESQIYYDANFENLFDSEEIDIAKAKSMYARADEMHNEAEAPKGFKTARGIEIGHVFYLGDKYSKALGATVQDKEGKSVVVKMGCYGIGISRLVGAIIEASHDAKGIIWPESIAPFKVSILNLKQGDSETDKACEDLYNQLNQLGIEALYDDRNDGVGAKFTTFELIGVPFAVAIGPRGLKEGQVELIERKTGEKRNIPIAEIIKYFK
jgi:prolyl-tRNA synthetase